MARDLVKHADLVMRDVFEGSGGLESFERGQIARGPFYCSQLRLDCIERRTSLRSFEIARRRGRQFGADRSDVRSRLRHRCRKRIQSPASRERPKKATEGPRYLLVGTINCVTDGIDRTPNCPCVDLDASREEFRTKDISRFFGGSLAAVDIVSQIHELLCLARQARK